MQTRRIGIIMNGVTGRMGTDQHLIRSIKAIRDQGFFGRILSVRGEFGYWVFTGGHPDQPIQRPSWNYLVIRHSAGESVPARNTPSAPIRLHHCACY